MSEQLNIYLAGSIENNDPELTSGWRKKLIAAAARVSYINILDPCRREPFDPEKSTTNETKRLVAQDLEDVRFSHLVIANLKDCSPEAKSWGTVMEIMYAVTRGIPVIVILDKDARRHPFIETLATEIHYTVDSAWEAAKTYGY